MDLIKIFLNILIVGLFLYSKLLPYKDKLHPQYKSIFDFFNTIFSPIFNFLKTFIKPFQVGAGLAVDMSQIVLLIIFLMLLKFL
ncbi:YggT family protein [Flavobacterium gelatinilyticum]|uniref:YggT family protein n=1 Tax=Flavobacterium gelatinilyticum TaxID=3003260 RepID=UPI002481609B|nr:YggT family protein [Flavobacterium gelatinilyticum]